VRAAASGPRPARLGGALLLALAPLATPASPPRAPGLTLGAELPLVEAKTLDGQPVSLPRDARGRPAILVIGFSKAAARVTAPWLDACRSAAASRPAGSEPRCYDLRMLEEVPRPFRFLVERSMRKGYPAELQRRTLLVYSDNDAWRARVGVADDKTAYLVGCDGEGRVRGTATGPFDERELERLLGGAEAIAGAAAHRSACAGRPRRAAAPAKREREGPQPQHVGSQETCGGDARRSGLARVHS
jgi:hypothetical protein